MSKLQKKEHAALKELHKAQEKHEIAATKLRKAQQDLEVRTIYNVPHQELKYPYSMWLAVEQDPWADPGNIEREKRTCTRGHKRAGRERCKLFATQLYQMNIELTATLASP